MVLTWKAKVLDEQFEKKTPTLGRMAIYVIDLCTNELKKDLEADVTNGFVEDSYDAKQILLKSMIAKVGEENIQEKNKDATAETCCFINKEAAQNFSDVILIPNPSTVPTTITNALHCAAKKKVKYGEEIAITRNQELMERSEVQVDDDKENEPQQVENLLVSRRKGRPETKQYKSSTEKKSRVKYACKMCGRTGHNSARCQNW
ncbi:hypothetical protein RhiirA4_494472 [Rhizophagus irregularis]|uniref:CCHC-type domain-containing protein n=1 Tax=Rhizophagus irregularis TaxID=588596 RepID=A0A2I1GYL7_9GLOM|nr:hypothetical protein RhiirA4_494472 [Rhizophagus irregularis]